MGDRVRWDALWRRLGARGDAAAVHDGLVGRYAEPHRAYHTLGHVAACLAEWDGARGGASDPDAGELALWFHDAVYDPRAGDNEARSADLAAAACREAGVGETFARRVAGLILETRHAGSPETPDGALVADADLAIFGRPPDEFAAYEAGIRREYAWVPVPEYRRGRSDILRRFLDRPAVYATSHFRERYEVQARRNLEGLLARLREA
jgi:predicted metal-dependent HD superfamily phosphohydrolase